MIPAAALRVPKMPLSGILHALPLTVLLAGAALAGEADVVGAEARRAADGTWNISATLRHADTGWEHYADAWEVLAPDGTLLGTRALLHPHVDEQPFMRGLSGIRIPEGMTSVIIRARDKVHEYGGRTFTLDLPRP